ncbi:unnamed protein product [Phytophthora lilii]|uniref:Unnamed protein product n=1 Tax=Phytophthora lilii TaxID=2077276 RepID=A0A9W6WNX7_9STRA|nr:unnamed protein product [Phytophthora lilii]
MAQADEPMSDYLINWNAGPLGVVLRPDLGADMPPVVAQLLPQPSVLKLAGVREGDLLISVNGKKTTRLGYEKVVRLLFKERLPMVLHFRSPLAVVAEEPASARGRARSRASSSAHKTPPRSRPRGRSEADERPARRDADHQSLSVHSDANNRKKKSKGKKHRREAKAEAEERRLRKQYSVVWERGSLGISFRAYNSKVNVPCVDFISASRGQGRGMDRVCVNDVLIAINGEKTKALGVEKVLRWLHVIEKPVVLRFHASSNRISNPAGGILPHLAEDEDTSARPRRPTMPTPLPQPEFEPAPRPPRRNNSVDQPVSQRTERGYSDDREYELQPAGVARSDARRHSRDSGTYFEKQPIEDYEPEYKFTASNIEVKERRYSNNSMNAYARHEDGMAGDFRREPMEDEPPQYDLRINAQIIPHRRQQYPPYDESNRYSQPSQQAQLPPTRSRTSSASRDELRRQQQESKPAPPPVTISPAGARPRLASRDSQVSNSSHMSFDEAAGVVARATGKPVEECEFGGVRLLDIKEGTVQAKLMFIYAKACLAKEGSSDDEPVSKDPKPPRTPGNPLGRKTHSKYLSYTILQDDAVASNHIPGLTNGDAKGPEKVEDKAETKVELVKQIGSDDGHKNSGVFDHKLDESFAKMQKDISIPQPAPPVVTPPLSSVGPSSSASSDTAAAAIPTSAPVVPTDDFISLKDFVVKGDGSLAERRTTSSVNSSATPVFSVDGDETGKAKEHDEQSDQTEKQSVSAEAVVDVVKEINSETVVEEVNSTEPESTVGEHPQAEAVANEVEKEEEVPKIVELEDERAVDQEHKDEPNHEHAGDHDDDDVASIDSSNERDLAASVASLDDLLELPLKDGNHDDEEHEEFVDDDDEEEEEHEKEHADEKAPMNTSLGMKLGQVQEEEAGETEEHHDQKHKDLETREGNEKHEENEEHVEHSNHDEDDDEEFGDDALTNPLVNELFRNIPDVREVIKDKPALVVLVKKSMIDEIQEILQSLQMELQFERHSTMAVGSTASPLRDSQHGRNTEGEHCYRCGATGELAELDVAGGHRELYCQECWELFFFSEDRSPVTRTSKTLAPLESSRLTADEDALDEALKYSFHDSSITREDMIHPWRYRQGSDSMSSSIRDSNASSITDRADEVWL